MKELPPQLRDLTVEVDTLVIDRTSGDLDTRARPMARDLKRRVEDEDWDLSFDTEYYCDAIQFDNFRIKYRTLIDFIETWALGEDHFADLDGEHVIKHGKWEVDSIADLLLFVVNFGAIRRIYEHRTE